MLLSEVTLLLVSAAEQAPEPEDVKAGWTAFAIFIGLIVVVGLLGFSLSRHLRRAAANQEAGMFGEDAPRDGGPTGPTGPTDTETKQPTP